MQSLEREQEKWVKRATVKDAKTVIKNLKESSEYSFRVMALNEAGMSDPKETTSMIVVQDNFLMPTIDSCSIAHGLMYVKAGSPLTLEVRDIVLLRSNHLLTLASTKIPCSGKPPPSISWKKDGVDLLPGQQVSIDCDRVGVACLKVIDMSQVGPSQILLQNLQILSFLPSSSVTCLYSYWLC